MPMQLTGSTAIARVLLFCIAAANAAALWPELSISRVDLNDNVFHYTLIAGIVGAVERGANPLDFWSPEWSLGYPVLRTYQPFAHWLVAGVWFALGKTASLMTVFVWVRFLAVALLPLSFFAASRLLGLNRSAALAAALLAPLVSTNNLYGVELGSFIWAGNGLFPQSIAVHLFVLSLGFGFRAVRVGSRMLTAGILVGLTLLCHVIYGYMAAVSLILLVAMPDAGTPAAVRLRRFLLLTCAAGLTAAFQLVPLIQDASIINHSVWEPSWKWDSFGAVSVLRWLFTGELLDHGRLPILTLLASGGVALACRKRRPEHVFVALGAALWIVYFFGRPTWGPLLLALGASNDMHLHRVIGGAHVFLVLLAAPALSWVWWKLSRRWHVLAAVLVTGLLVYPMATERAALLARNADLGQRNLAINSGEEAAIESAITKAKQRGGRAFAGLAATWGGQFKVGDVPFYAHLSTSQTPAAGFLYHAMALTGDVMVRFSDQEPSHYRLFDVRTLITPADRILPLAKGLQPGERFGRFQTFEAPVSGYFDLVDVIAAVKTTRRNHYSINSRWLQSPLVAQRMHLLLDFSGADPAGMARLDAVARLPVVASAPPPAGIVLSERTSGDEYEAELDLARPAYLLFKMTWHPRWRAYVDGTPAPVVVLSPGFSAAAVSPGRHRVEFRYEPGLQKWILLAAGLVGLFALRRLKGLIERMQWPAIPARLATAAAVVALSLPVLLPLLTSALIWGHDAFSYFPRVIEVGRNLSYGILLPRWAPDFGNGYGQPLFLFHPPFFYWLATAWKLLGFNPLTAVNLACALIVLLAAAAMFALGRLYFGDRGGSLAAAAYLYAPYFAVDLFVRSALEEFAALALMPLALYGFAAFAHNGRRRDWLMGVLSYAALLSCHFPAALLFTPLLAAFVMFTAWRERSTALLANLAGGMVLGLGAGACMWVPALLEKQYVSMERALQGHGQFADHFVDLQQLFSTVWGYGLSGPGPNDGMSFSLGWSHVMLAVLAWAWLLRQSAAGVRILVQFFGLAAIVLCLFMLDDSAFLWKRLPFLPFVQFPWRLLGPASLCVALVVAGLGPGIASLGRWCRCAFWTSMALLIIPNLHHLDPGRTIDVDLASWTPLGISARGFETTTMGEVTPRWMTTLPPYNPVPAVVIAGDARLSEEVVTPFSYSAIVTTGGTLSGTSRVRLSRAWFPGWQVYLDGRAADVGPAPETGLIEFAVPAGTHRVEARFGRSPIRQTAEWVSAVALAALLLLAWRGPVGSLNRSRLPRVVID